MAPVRITASTVTNVPIHSVSVMVAIELMRRYSKATLKTPTTVTTSIIWPAVIPFQM